MQWTTRGASGGGALYFTNGGGGAFHVGVTVPRKLSDSSAGAELIQATITLKAILGFRIMARELRLTPTGPTPLHMDANAVLLGVKREKVAKEMRYMAGRYAMMRNAQDNGDIKLTKVSTLDNKADICTKPIVGNEFKRHRARLLGLDEPL